MKIDRITPAERAGSPLPGGPALVGDRIAPSRIGTSSLRKVAQAARSGLRRYPRALWDSAAEAMRSGSIAHPHNPEEGIPDLLPHRLGAVWLGHGSVLLRIGGINVLMDPVFSRRIGMSIGERTFGLARLQPVPVPAERLPSVDLILISHAHFDHLDKPTLRRLASRHTTVITARRTTRLIPSGFARVIEMDWHSEVRFKGLHLTALRPAHWGARTAVDMRRGYNSYLLRDSSHPHEGVLLAGDTAYTDAFDRLDQLTLAVLGIGAYEPWEHAHATPEQVWRMFMGSGAHHLLPVHHSTFPLGDEHVDEPMQRLLRAAGERAHAIVHARPGMLWTPQHDGGQRPAVQVA
jgi:L-ascorbate metabolism protein UlaG (beta-lactamase superfamily)